MGRLANVTALECGQWGNPPTTRRGPYRRRGGRTAGRSTCGSCRQSSLLQDGSLILAAVAFTAVITLAGAVNGAFAVVL